MDYQAATGSQDGFNVRQEKKQKQNKNEKKKEKKKKDQIFSGNIISCVVQEIIHTVLR